MSVVLLSGGSAETGDRSNAVARYMIDTEEALRASGLAWTMVRPRMFMTNAFQWLPQIMTGVVRAPWPDVPSAVIDPADIAAVAVQALLSAEHVGRIPRDRPGGASPEHITDRPPRAFADRARANAERFQ